MVGLNASVAGLLFAQMAQIATPSTTSPATKIKINIVLLHVGICLGKKNKRREQVYPKHAPPRAHD